MITERFAKLLKESRPEQSITGVLLWKPATGNQRGFTSGAEVRIAKKPILERFASDDGFVVNDFDALPNAVVLGCARDWQRVLDSGAFDLDAPEIVLDVNFEVPMID